jgi:uncharacterized protein YbjT (DUF2867 family)
MDSMKVLVIGASGATGTIAVRLLLERGDEVTAFVRSDLPTKHERLRLARGDVRDASSIEAALEGQDAVFSAFGPRSLKKSDIQEAFMRNLVGAMKTKGVKRLVNLSAWGVGETHDSLPFIGRLFVDLLLSRMMEDKHRGELILVKSDLDWINVRPGRLTNGRKRGGVKASLDPKGLKPFLTREDLAEFMIDQLSRDTWVRQSPLVGY